MNISEIIIILALAVNATPPRLGPSDLNYKCSSPTVRVGSPPQNGEYGDLSSAILNAIPNDVISIRDGIYTIDAQLVVQIAGITLCGQSVTGTVIQSTNVATDSSQLLYIGADNFAMYRLTLRQQVNTDTYAMVSAVRER